MAYTARFGNGRLGSVAHHRDGLARQHELPQINGYPFHPSEQDMISAAGIKDQELTIIVSMMLIDLALLRLSHFKRLVDTQGSSYWSRCIREFGERDAWDGYVIGLVTMLALSAAYNTCLAPLRPLRDAGLGSRALALQLVSRTCR